MSEYLYDNLESVDKLPDDTKALFAIRNDGTVVQKVVSFTNFVPSVRWEPVEPGGFCQMPSKRLMEDIEDDGGDPRSAFSRTKNRKKYRGHPDERAPQ